MGAEVFAVFLAHPISMAVGVAIVFALSSLHYRHTNERPPPIGPRRLFAGYLSAFLICIVIAAASSYVPQAGAATKWHVPAERYWQVQVNAFLTDLVLLAYVTLIGIAAVGLPIIFALGRRGLATLPWVLSASVVVSLVLATLLTAGDNPAFRHLAYMVKYLVGTHLLLSLGFCLGAGIPWKQRVLK